MRYFFKKKSKLIVTSLFILFPIIFIGILKLFVKFVPGEMIGSIDGWLGFLGGYFGVIGTVGTVWWQLNEEKNKKISEKELEYIKYLKYIQNIIIQNLEKLEKNGIFPSITYNQQFSRPEEIIDFIMFEESIINKNIINFIEKNHSCILNLNNIMIEFKKNLPIFFEDIQTKQEKILPFINKKYEESKKITPFEKIPEENIICSNFKILSGFLVNGGAINGYGPYLYYNNTLGCFPENELKIINFKGYTANGILETKILNNNSFKELYLDYYNEVVLVFFYRPYSELEEVQEEYKSLSSIVGKIHSHDKYKLELLKKYEENLKKCNKVVNEYLVDKAVN